jgi:glycosyltransferase involved in cell wall biosynthesis
MNRLIKEEVDGITIFKASFFPLYPFHVKLHGMFINSLLKSLEPELTLIHLHSPLVPPINTKLPIVTTIHTLMKIDSKYHEARDPYSLAEKVQSMYFSPYVESKLLKISNKLTVVTPTVAEELREYGVNPKTVTTVWNGVDEKRFYPVHDRVLTDKYVLYTGILRARKGLFDLLDCAEQVCSVDPTVKFVISGTGPFFGKVESEIQRKGLHEKVILPGYVTRAKLIELYQNATIHVVPSHYEGLPTVLLEAMACGLPVVATDIGGNREVISNGVNGFLVPPKTPKVMAETILNLLGDNGLRERTGKAARKTIEKQYTWDKIADHFTSIYESALKK